MQNGPGFKNQVSQRNGPMVHRAVSFWLKRRHLSAFFEWEICEKAQANQKARHHDLHGAGFLSV